MRSRFLRSLIFTWGVLVTLPVTMTESALAQEKDHSDVELLREKNLGPYEPEKTPDLKSVAQQVVEQTNAFRKTKQRSELSTDETLIRSAKAFADYMAKTDRYGHEADDRTPGQRAKADGYEFCQIAENIAWLFSSDGFETKKLATQAFTGWKESPGHRENMLREHVTQTGVAISQSEVTGVFYAVQLFGRPISAAIQIKVRNETGQAITYTVGEQEYQLQERFTRTHTLCLPAPIAFMTTTTQTFEPTTDMIYVVRSIDGQFKIREQMPPKETEASAAADK